MLPKNPTFQPPRKPMQLQNRYPAANLQFSPSNPSTTQSSEVQQKMTMPFSNQMSPSGIQQIDFNRDVEPKGLDFGDEGPSPRGTHNNENDGGSVLIGDQNDKQADEETVHQEENIIPQL